MLKGVGFYISSLPSCFFLPGFSHCPPTSECRCAGFDGIWGNEKESCKTTRKFPPFLFLYPPSAIPRFAPLEDFSVVELSLS